MILWSSVSDLSIYLLRLFPLQKLTEQRVPVFSHEIVPDYLRTKPDPEVEEQEKQLSTEAARIGPEVAQVGGPTPSYLCAKV